MTIVADSGIAQAAVQAGFPTQEIGTAVAVALAESGGRSDASHQNTDIHLSKDFGLWQINDYWNKSILKSGDWQNPTDNARMAYQIWAVHRSWTPWSTYNSRAYLLYAGRGAAAAGHSQSVSDPSAGQEVTPSQAGVGKRALYGFVGIVLLLFGVYELPQVQSAVKSAAKLGEKVAIA